MNDLAQWLERLGLARYAQLFAENDIDFSVLPHLTDDNLKELGLTFGHRVKLKAALETLSPHESSTPATSPAARQRGRPQPAEAELRQVTVMFCDLVGSTALSTLLDAETYHE
ncbi:MAG TPA: hypothetical protein VKT70_03285, partial [Stellaceae bacterium]|nr:hypothetical protein [Stellaceae bacterium]